MARDTEYILKLIEEHGMATAQDIFAAREAALNSDERLAKRLGQVTRLAGGTTECFDFLYAGK